MGPNPVGGLSRVGLRRGDATAPTLKHGGLGNKLPEVGPHRPRLGEKENEYRIEPTDYFDLRRCPTKAAEKKSRLLGGASVELGEHLSMQPSSTAQARDSW